MWFLHDRAPPQFSNALANHLTSTFQNRTVGRNDLLVATKLTGLQSSAFLPVGHTQNKGYCTKESTQLELWIVRSVQPRRKY
jgi:hypothetical protein